MNHIFLIADSGSTKTDWCVVEKGQPTRLISTKGMNPFFQTPEEMETEIRENLLTKLPPGEFSAVYFYGAGCTPQKAPIVEEVLRKSISVTGEVEVNSDLLAAARGLCLHQPGIACILGTGSNSCFYDGEQIAFNVPALGFILGDEGSGANLGKLLVGDILKNQLPEELKQKFFKQFHTDMADIIERVYRQPFPSRFLASLNIFLEENKHIPAIKALLINAFKAFIQRNVMQYDYRSYPMNCIGTIANIYKEELQEAANALGVKLGVIAKSPMEGLIKYYTQKE